MALSIGIHCIALYESLFMCCLFICCVYFAVLKMHICVYNSHNGGYGTIELNLQKKRKN